MGLWNRIKEKVCAACDKKSGEFRTEDEQMVQRNVGKEIESEN